VGPGEQSWVVLADPEGSEFCVPASLMGSRASLRSSRRRSAAAPLELVERRSTWADEPFRTGGAPGVPLELVERSSTWAELRELRSAGR